MNENLQLIGLLVTGSGVVVALLGFVAVQNKNLREVIASGDKAVADATAKARHDLANQVQRDMSNIDRDVETLKREVVRREDLNAVDSRWGQTVARLEAKLDRVADGLGHVTALEVSMKACVEQIAGIVKRLDARDPRDNRAA